MRFLSYPEIDGRFHSIYNGLEGTCEWLSRQAEYTAWMESKPANQHHRILWIKGKPGAGKSTLMKMLTKQIDSPEQINKPAIMHFFFDGKSNNKIQVTAQGLFRSLICQLLQQDRRVLDSFLPLHRRKVIMHGTKWEWHTQELKDYLVSTCAEQRKRPLFLMIDALDECDELDLEVVADFCRDLVRLSASKSSTIKLCISSRYHLMRHVEEGLEIHLENHNKSDILLYIERWLKPNDDIPGLRLLATEVVKRASGVFLWVVLVVKTLVKARDEGETLNRMLQIVQDLPEQLNDLIRQLVKAISDNHREDALRIMQWVCFSQRELSITELRFALEMDGASKFKTQGQLTSSPTFISSDSQMERLIRSRTKGLVETKLLDAGSQNLKCGPVAHVDQVQTVQFIHGSVKDFLLHHGGFAILNRSLAELSITASHRHLAASCVHYLGYEEVSELPIIAAEADPAGSREAAAETISLYKTFPFLEYSVDNVFDHIADAAFSRSTKPSSQDILSSMSRSFHLWRRLADLNGSRYFHEPRGPCTALGHVAAEYNLVEWVMELINQGLDVNSIGSRNQTMLQTAAMKGHETLVSQLLSSGASVQIYGQGRLGNALSAAASSNKPSIVRAILVSGADVNAGGSDFSELGTALQTAAQFPDINDEIIDLLLDAGADIHIQAGRHGNALQAAASAGNQHVVKRLIATGAEVNAEGGEYGSALQAAAANGHDAVLALLLANDASPHIKSGDYGPATMVAACAGHVNIVRHLIALDLAPLINVQQPSGASEYSTTLEQRIEETMALSHSVNKWHEAVANDDTATMLTLLNSGLDVNVRGGDQSSAWHAAAFLGNASAMSILVTQENIKPDMRDWNGCTPLWTAASEGYLPIVLQLLGTGRVDVRVRIRRGANALWWPCYDGNVEMVRLLLERGADPGEKDANGVSPVMKAREGKRTEVLQLLAEHGKSRNHGDDITTSRQTSVSDR